MDYLIDTDVLIDHLRGEPLAKEFLKSRKSAGDGILISTVSKAELYAGVRLREEKALKSLLDSMEEVVIDGEVALYAGKYRRKYGASHGVLLPDALVAGCARATGATLVSLNRKHYPMRDIRILVPYHKH